MGDRVKKWLMKKAEVVEVDPAEYPLVFTGLHFPPGRQGQRCKRAPAKKRFPEPAGVKRVQFPDGNCFMVDERKLERP